MHTILVLLLPNAPSTLLCTYLVKFPFSPHAPTCSSYGVWQDHGILSQSVSFYYTQQLLVLKLLSTIGPLSHAHSVTCHYNLCCHSLSGTVFEVQCPIRAKGSSRACRLKMAGDSKIDLAGLSRRTIGDRSSIVGIRATIRHPLASLVAHRFISK